MRRHLFEIAVALLLVAGTTRDATAQSPFTVPNNFSQLGAGPTTSPYLNLLRRNTPAYLNYYGLVRPQFEAQNALQGIQGQLAFAQQQINQNNDPVSNLPATGQHTQFLNYGSYFGTGRVVGNGNTLGRGGISQQGGAAPQFNANMGGNFGTANSSRVGGVGTVGGARR